MVRQIKKADEAYELPARLVHNLIRSIFGTIVIIGGYMIIWAINDAAWKAQLDIRIEKIEQALMAIDAAGILPRAEERIRSLEQRMHDHEELP